MPGDNIRTLATGEVPFDPIRYPFAISHGLGFLSRTNKVLDQKNEIASNLIDNLADTKFKLKLYIMSNLIDTYIAGGVEYMHPITLLFLFNLGVTGYIVFCRVTKKAFDRKWIESIKHASGLAVACGTLGTLAGLFMAFNALETIKEVLPFQVIMGGLKVALINVLYGLIIFFISMLAYMVLKLKVREVER